MNLVFSRRLGRSLAALLLVGAAVAAPRLASAYPLIDNNITIAAPAIVVTAAQAAAGFSGYFDVTLTDTAAEHIAQFQATMTLSGPGTNVQLVGSDLGQLTNGEYNDSSNPAYQATRADGIGDAAGSSPNLLDPYVLGNVYATTKSSDATGGGQNFFNATSSDNSDSTTSGTVTLVANTTYSLMQVYFTVAPGTGPGTYSLTFDTAVPYNNTTGQNHNDPSADYVNLVSNANQTSYQETKSTAGSITILAPTPEPSSVVLMALGFIGLVGFGVRRARKA